MTDLLRTRKIEPALELTWDQILNVMVEMGDPGPGPVAVTNLMRRKHVSVWETANMINEDLLQLQGMGEKGIERLNKAIALALLST